LWVMIATSPSNSLSTTKHLEAKRNVMTNGNEGRVGYGGAKRFNEEENDNSDVEMEDASDYQENEGSTSADFKTGADDSKTMNGNGVKEGSGSEGLNGSSSNGNGRSGLADESDVSKVNKSQHHTVASQEASTADKLMRNNLKREDDGASSSSSKNNSYNIQGEIQTDKNNNNSTTGEAASAPVPLLKGILSYIDNELTRKHTITGMWNFESSTENQPQTFQLARNLAPDEDPKELPKDGEFQGSFRVMYKSVSQNGKTKTRTRVIQESGVKLVFTKQEGKEDSFDIKGKGTNMYGVFSIFGIAIRDELEKDKAYKVELRKKYIATPDPPTGSAPPSVSSKKSKSKSKKRKLATTSVAVDKNEGPLPDPSESFPSNVVCLRGKATRDSSVQEGFVHKIEGLWSNGLDLVLSDPKNEHGFCNEFEYEHRGSGQTDVFPISGRYTGWFNFTEDGKKTRITERDVVLKFKKNNAGYYNVEGKGTNMFGKYSISGTLDKENTITLFRHFAPIKAKKTVQPALSAAPIQINNQQDSLSRMTLDDVDVPDQPSYEPITAPIDGHYQALSRGVFKVNEDGAHTCSGKWAQSRSHHTTNVTSNFHFGLEEHHAKQALEDMKRKGLIDIRDANDGKIFPVDSANYKGSFKMKKGTAKLQPVIDHQIVMKFRKNTSGSYNVYGKGVNAYGSFDLIGTLILFGPLSGNVELFRIYPPVPISEPPPPPAQSHPKAKSLPLAKNAPTKKSVEKAKPPPTPVAPAPGLIRRESSRQVKLPSHLADDDPAARKARLMEKCMSILKIIKENDKNRGAYFLEPVDPVAHNIPTYHQIITNPMDLGTIEAKMDSNEVDSPEEFARLTRLVFENAVKFNENPMNLVHQSARDLLSIFNQKFRDVEQRLLTEKKKPTTKEMKEQKRKLQKEEKKRLDKEKKRKREEEEDPKTKQLSLLQSSSEQVGKSLEALSTATSAGIHQSSAMVTRNEFMVMTDVIRQIHTQLSHVQAMIQLMSTSNATASTSTTDTTATTNVTPGVEGSAPKKKKGKKATKTQAKPVAPEPVAPVAAPAPTPAPVLVPPPEPVRPIEEEPLTHEEQEELTSAINEMSDDKIQMVIDIIKKSKQASDLIDDDQEIELDLDQIDTATQRKLLKFALKNKPKPKPARKSQKGKKKKTPTPPPAPLEPEPVVEPPVSDTKKDDDKGYRFGASFSDSEEEEDDVPVKENDNPNSSEFQISENGPIDDGEESDENNEGPDWTNLIPNEDAPENDDSEDDNDDPWEGLREETHAQQKLDKERQEREEKMLNEQKIEKERSLAEAAEKKRKLQEERKEQEAEESRKRDQKEREMRERAEKIRKENTEAAAQVEKEIDIDDGMGGIYTEYENIYADNDVAGGASPSSDFGF